MKKNMLTIVVIAVSFINLVLTAVMLFVVVPTSNQTRSLIDQVTSIIDLELQSPEPKTEYNLGEMDNITYSSAIQGNLKAAATDKVPHYVLIDQFTLQINKKSEVYKTFSAKMVDYESMITEAVSGTFRNYTFDELVDNPDTLELVKKDILDTLASQFGTIDYAVGISFKNIRFQ